MKKTSCWRPSDRPDVHERENHPEMLLNLRVLQWTLRQILFQLLQGGLGYREAERDIRLSLKAGAMSQR